MPIQSLAEFLGTKQAAINAEDESSKPQSAKRFCRGILNSQEYRDSLKNRIMAGELSPAVECKLYEYAYGKPVDRVEVKDTTNRLAGLSAEQLENRAMQLAQMARQMRESQEQSTESETTSIH